LFGRPAEEATVATDLVDLVAGWVGPGGEPKAALPALTETVAMDWLGGQVSESFLRVGRACLTGVLTRPSGVERATVVFLNSGSEVHVGPGRAWVEYARGLAVAGYETLRVDFRGWGDSPDEGFAPGRPYDRHTWDDAAEIVADLRRRGRRTIVLAGLCAGAWVALKVATRIEVDGVIAINPQLYWQPGDPVEALMTTTRQRRLPEIAYFKEHGSRLEETEQHPASPWLSELRRAGAPVMTLFARGDDGLEFLRDRLPAAWEAALGSGVVQVVEVDIDHPMHRHWQRHAVVDAMLAFLDDHFAGGTPPAREPAVRAI
jgi:pimeloyl-ACP methyl ester carboxylesterase